MPSSGTGILTIIPETTRAVRFLRLGPGVPFVVAGADADGDLLGVRLAGLVLTL